ncbi:S-layer homology domain-containing protein [Gloeobacter violaceus]|uniref:Glr4112 protein n=1 Tax=Gloeobacter violaceus (strain ATCC 29082 / PCC 7421) TaxID=251221 RepID=Q7NDX0_GLOVI|nr:S-layer homology domain-containing protein [Gloeobacter violaceus]BAC92053.1 glr4112 [Gloeobacter violaceus PCC 7421]
MDKFCEAGAAIGLALGLTVVAAQAANFGDTAGYWAEPYVSTLADRKFIGGFPDGSFRPNDAITRAQFAAIAAKALDLPAGGGGPAFNDVPANYWATGAIAAVSNSGLVTGFPDGSFRPEERITRAQALVILAKALGDKGGRTSVNLDDYTDVQAVPDWARPSVTKAAESGIIVNFPDPAVIKPNALATRGEVAALMYQTLSRSGRDLPPLNIGSLAPAGGGGAGRGQLAIERVVVQPDRRVVQAGEELVVRAEGTPGAEASFSVQGIAQGLPMQEVERGIYEGRYTVKRGDRERNARLAVTLKSRGESVTREAERPYAFGSGAVGGAGRGDFNGDGRPDVLWSRVGGSEVRLWLMEGTRKGRELALGQSPGRDWRLVGSGDFDGDGLSDLLWHNQATGELLQWRLSRAGKAQPVAMRTEPVARRLQVGGTGDFDGDGRADILWRNPATGRNTLWLMDAANRRSQKPLPDQAGANLLIAGVGDFDGDGGADVLWRNRVSGANSLWLMNGTQVVRTVAIGEAPPQWQVGSIADYNGDGQVDILWRRADSGESVFWIMNGTERTATAAAPAGPGGQWEIAGPR